MDKQLIFPMAEKYQEYVIDESKFTGYADSISFPETEEEIIEIVKTLRQTDTGITIQSGKTGIVGGSVPQGGHIMNLSQMKRVGDSQEMPDGSARLTVEPGLNLMELNKEIGRIFRKNPVLWPPQPTETSATLGGIISAAAKGINGCHYGDSRKYVAQIRMVLSDGTVKILKRDQDSKEMDLILGGEGIYGVIDEAVLILVPKPESVWGISFFFENKQDIECFTMALAGLQPEGNGFITAAEYLDRIVLDLIEQRKSTMTKIKDLPDIDKRFAGMVYLEISGLEEDVELLAEKLMEMAVECNSDPEEAWAVTGESEIDKMHAFRHGAAEVTNLYIEEARKDDSRITKLGTDMQLKDISFGEMIAMYEGDIRAKGLTGCIFGHLLEGHLHVNILPADYEEYKKGKELLEDWAKRAGQGQNQIAAEHGIGKLKAHLTDFILTKEQQTTVKTLKKKYDSAGMWNQGNIFPEGR